MKHIDLKHGEYEITLLTEEEYWRCEELIPAIYDYWWLQSPGNGQDDAAGVNYGGYGVSYGVNLGVRPALKSEAINLPVGERFIALGNRWVVIADHVAVSEDVVTHRRYDKKSNDWETSELKAWLEDWAKDGERREE